MYACAQLSLFLSLPPPSSTHPPPSTILLLPPSSLLHPPSSIILLPPARRFAHGEEELRKPNSVAYMMSGQVSPKPLIPNPKPQTLNPKNPNPRASVDGMPNAAARAQTDITWKDPFQELT
eukprot:3941521-Rhodomonas_salina.1